MKNILTRIVSTAFVASFSLSASVFAANPASITLATSSSSAANGSTFTVSAYENGDNVTGATVKFSYDSSKLKLQNSTCGSSLPNQIPESDGNVVTCYISGGASVNGTVLVANASFIALAGSGPSSISVSSGSMITALNIANSIWDQVVNSVSINLTTPTSTPTPTPVVSKPTPTPVKSANTAVSTTEVSVDSGTEATPTPTPTPTPTGTTLGVETTNNDSTNTSDNDKSTDSIWPILIVIASAIVVIVVGIYYRSRSVLASETTQSGSKNNSSKNANKRFKK